MNEAAISALKEYRRKIDAGETERPETKNPMEKAAANPRSLRSALNAKCWDCACGSRTEVSLCVCTDCPLWGLRPWQKKLDEPETVTTEMED